MMAFLSTLDWELFPLFGITTIVVGLVAAYLAWRDHRRSAVWVMVLALLIYSLFIAGMWLSQERPPMRTQGETRLLYSFFVLLSGLLVYVRWGYKWIFTFSTLLAAVFIITNIVKPQIHSKSMMAALQSYYFVPHVISYMFSYGLLGVALLVGLYVVWKGAENDRHKLYVMDNLVYTGLGFLMIGLLLGALWAKQAWGTYWGWDPKETWAAITMAAYLIFLHHRRFHPKRVKQSVWLLAVSFIFLQMCWYGVNYLPSASMSVHTYGM
ncbi:MAG: cytochrome c biogenesis protein CcsA [Porphyromonas sp.]|nr:cytochrome c biogenesis protein CcsA [Porphyromonas sp.]